MKILALDCSGDLCSVALQRGKKRFERDVKGSRQHNQVLLPMIAELMTESGLSFADLDALAFGAGPGSFTGLRLAAGVVQGLAYAASKPVMPISSLQAAALQQARQQNWASGTRVMVAEDARKGDVYFAVYDIQAEGVRVVEADALIPASELTAKQLIYTQAQCLGGGWPGLEPIRVHASSVLNLALLGATLAPAVSAEQALPVYLRDHVDWQKWRPKAIAFNE